MNLLFLTLMIGIDTVDQALIRTRVEMAMAKARSEIVMVNFRHTNYEPRDLSVPPYTPPPVPTYSQLRSQAVTEKKPLIIFVNCEIPGVPIGYLVHRTDKFINPQTGLPLTRPSIIVSAVINNDLMCVKVLDYEKDKPTWPGIYEIILPYIKNMQFICPDGKCDPV